MGAKIGGQYGPVGEFDNGNSGTAKTLDWNNGRVQKVTLTGVCTFTFSNPKVGFTYLVRAVANGTGGYALTWPAAVDWGTAGAPAALAANKGQLFSFYWEGTKYLAAAGVIYY